MLADFRYTSHYLRDNLLTRDTYVLRLVFVQISDEKTRQHVRLVCKFWRENCWFINPTWCFLRLSSIDRVHQLWSFAGAYIERSAEVLLRACRCGIYRAVDELVDAPGLQRLKDSPTKSLIDEAAANGHDKIVRRLLNSPLCPRFEKLTHALLTACEKENVRIAFMLLECDDVRKQFNNVTALARPIARGQYPLVRRILECCPLVRRAVRYQLLLDACIYGRYAIIDYVLTTIPTILFADVDNEMLFIAAAHGYYGLVRRIVRQPGVSLRNNARAVFYAAIHGHVDVLAALLAPERGTPRELGALVLVEGARAVFAAACCNQVAVLRFLLDIPMVRNTLRRWIRAGVSYYYFRTPDVVERSVPHWKKTRGSIGYNTGLAADIYHFLPLEKHAETRRETHVPDLATAAALTGAVDVVDMLLRECDMLVANLGGAECQPLVAAVTFHRWEVVERLIADKRINVNVNNELVFHEAVADGRGDIVQKLLANESRRVNPGARYGAALLKAVNNGAEWMVELLLKSPLVDPGANRNQALSAAINNKHVSIALRLVRDRRIVDVGWDHNSLLRRACLLDSTELVRALLSKRGANAGATDNEALRNAVKASAYGVIRVLLTECGHNPAVADGFNPSYNDNVAMLELCKNRNTPSDIIQAFLVHPRTTLSVIVYETILRTAALGICLSTLDVLLESGWFATLLPNFGPQLLRVGLISQEPALMRYLLSKPSVFSAPMLAELVFEHGHSSTECVLVCLEDPRVRALVDPHRLAIQCINRTARQVARWLLSETSYYNPGLHAGELLRQSIQHRADWMLNLLLVDERIDLLAHCDAALAVARIRTFRTVFGMIVRAVYTRAMAGGDAAAITRAKKLLEELETQAVLSTESAQQPGAHPNYLLLGHAQQFINYVPSEYTKLHQVDVSVPVDAFEGEDDDDEEDTRSEELTLPLVPTSLPAKQTGAKRIADVSIDKNKRRRT